MDRQDIEGSGKDEASIFDLSSIRGRATVFESEEDGDGTFRVRSGI
jgi:hypothetical protein